MYVNGCVYVCMFQHTPRTSRIILTKLGTDIRILFYTTRRCGGGKKVTYKNNRKR